MLLWVVLVVLYNFGFTTCTYWTKLPKAQPVGEPKLCLQDEDYCFSYDRRALTGPSRWFKVCDTQECFGGLNQSPIWIDPYAVSYQCDPVNRLGYSLVSVTGMLENDGYYPKIASENNDLNKAVLYGVPGCRNRYLLDSVHIHYGRRGDIRGSEHVIKGKNYDAEMHMVHVREDLPRGQASNFKAGQAVVAVFFSLTEGEWSWQLDQILNEVAAIEEYKGASCNDTACQTMADLRSMQLVCPHWKSGAGHCGSNPVNFVPDWLLPRSRDFYYYYYGSLTTPTLSESVLWQIMMSPIRITKTQLEFMRRLESRFRDYYGNFIPVSRHGNIRPLQNRNGRTVYANKCFEY